jgi:hypothetical protein
MTKFQREKFSVSRGYIEYYVYGVGYKFVARFKYRTGDAGPFITFLIKNFTVEEYFSRYEAGEHPLPILESKGFILPHIKKWLKIGGYPVTREGYQQYLADETAKVKARLGIKD